MENRQLRLGTRAQIQQQLAGFVNKKINIVRNDNSVLLTRLVAISGDMLTVQNMRQRTFTIPVADIYEIIIDLKA